MVVVVVLVVLVVVVVLVVAPEVVVVRQHLVVGLSDRILPVPKLMMAVVDPDLLDHALEQHFCQPVLQRVACLVALEFRVEDA